RGQGKVRDQQRESDDSPRPGNRLTVLGECPAQKGRAADPNRDGERSSEAPCQTVGHHERDPVPAQDSEPRADQAYGDKPEPYDQEDNVSQSAHEDPYSTV